MKNCSLVKPRKDPLRENRIHEQAIVYAYGPEEKAMSWYYYLEGKLSFPFRAECAASKITSPLKKSETVAGVAVGLGIATMFDGLVELAIEVISELSEEVREAFDPAQLVVAALLFPLKIAASVLAAGTCGHCRGRCIPCVHLQLPLPLRELESCADWVRTISGKRRGSASTW
jgi:hypothetical protein